MAGRKSKNCHQAIWLLLVCALCVLSLGDQDGEGNNEAGGPAADAPRRQELVPAMFIFGDSLIDNGNNNQLASLAKANYYPYGIDFQGGATGRFSNGYTMVDTIGTYSSDIITNPRVYLLIFRSTCMLQYIYSKKG